MSHPAGMSRREELPQTLRELPFSRSSAQSSGISNSRLRASDLERPFHAVRRVAGGPRGIRWQCRAYQERMNPAHCFSHQTAATLYGLPLPLYSQAARKNNSAETVVQFDALHVAALAPSRAPSGAGITGHCLDAVRWSKRELLLRDVIEDQLFAFPIAAPEMVWAQLAAELEIDDLVALGDAIVGGSINPGTRSEGPLACISDLRRMAESNRGCRGAESMRRAIDHIRIGSLSRPESLLRIMLVRAGLPEPLPNRRVIDRNGRLIAMADLCWPDFRVLIEYQGDGHRTSKAKFRTDITRLDEYLDGDWLPIQVSAYDIFVDPNPLMARMWRRLQSCGWNPGRRQVRHIASARP